MKRGIEAGGAQSQVLGQPNAEIYSSSYSQTPYYPPLSPPPPSPSTLSSSSSLSSTTSTSSSAYDPYYKPTTVKSSPYPAISSYSSSNYASSPYGLLNSYGVPLAKTNSNFAATVPGPYGVAFPTAANYPPVGVSPYATAGIYPYNLFQTPYYYPNYYNQPPFLTPSTGYLYKPKGVGLDNEEDDDDLDRLKGKSKKPGINKNHIRIDTERDVISNEYVDGANFIISSVKDLDGESSTHRTPSASYNQIENSDVHPRTVVLPKATYRLVSVSSGKQQQQSATSDSSPAPAGYIKIEKLEQLMRQALAKLLAQNAAQQANLAQIQEASKVNKDTVSQYVSVPSIAKTGLSYVVNPTILNRVTATTSQSYNPSQLINTNTNKQKTVTSVSVQQSPGIYVPPIKTNTDQSTDYGDYDTDSVTNKSTGSYQPTVEPARNYSYSTYRSTQQTSLEDVNFGNKQTKSKS